MHLCFIDESSTPPKPTKVKPRPFFTLAAVFIPVAQWKAIAVEIQQLKANPKYAVRGEIKWRYFGRDNDDKKNNVSHLDKPTQDEFRRRLYKILSDRNSVKSVVAVTKIEEAYKLDYYEDENDIYAYAYKQIVERFQYHLQEVGRASGSEQLGMVIADHRGRDDDERLRRYHQLLLNATASNLSRLSNLIEGIFLTPSDTSIGIQLADMVAGAVNRRYCSNDRAWSESIKPILRSRSDGTIDGYGLLKLPKGSW